MLHLSRPAGRTFLVLGSLSLAASSIAATPQTSYSESHRIALAPDIANNGGVSRTAVGHLSGDQRNDVAVLAGSDVFVLGSPAVHNYWQRLTPTSSGHSFDDVEVVDQASSALDLLVTSSSLGIFSWEFDTSTQTFISTPLATYSDARGSASICMPDMDADGDYDLFFADGDSNGAVGLTAVGGGSYTTRFNLALSEPVLQVAAGDWIGSSDVELFAMTESTLYVLDQQGVILESFTSLGDFQSMAVFRDYQETKVELSVVELLGGPQAHRALAPGGASHSSIPLGFLGIVSHACFDWDGDGDDDVFFCSGVVPSGFAIGNVTDVAGSQANSFTGLPKDTITFDYAPPGTSTSGQDADFAWGDLDNDGDLDFSLVCRGSSDNVVFLSPAVDESLLQPRLTSAGTVPASGSTWESQITVALPETPLPTATHLEIVVYGLMPVAPNGFKLSGTVTTTLIDASEELPIGDETLTITDLPGLNEESEFWSNPYALVLRALESEGTGTEAVWTSSVYELGTDGDGTTPVNQRPIIPPTGGGGLPDPNGGG